MDQRLRMEISARLPSAETFDTAAEQCAPSGIREHGPGGERNGFGGCIVDRAQSKVTAVAQRSLPTILIALIVLSGALLAATVGMSALT